MGLTLVFIPLLMGLGILKRDNAYMKALIVEATTDYGVGIGALPARAPLGTSCHMSSPMLASVDYGTSSNLSGNCKTGAHVCLCRNPTWPPPSLCVRSQR